jgi:DNA topoisomerase 2-associated protein PAT1
MLTMLTLLSAVFSQLDVVRQAPVLDTVENTEAVQAAERETQAFTGSVLQSILPVISKASLRIVSGLLGLLVSRSNITIVAQTRPGLAMLTLLLSRVEVIKQSMAATSDPAEVPTPEDANQWSATHNPPSQPI